MAELVNQKNVLREAEEGHKLKKELGLFSVFSISTAGLLSAGFFILPGLTTHFAGTLAFTAYLIAGLLMIPALLSMAELSTALPRAGGPYYFLDRSLGPMVGTVGGFGTWLALVLKSCFAFIGLAGYLVVLATVLGMGGEWVDNEWFRRGVAVVLTVAFAALNIFGAKETTKLQNILMVCLSVVLAYFIVQGVVYVLTEFRTMALLDRLTPIMGDPLLGTTGSEVAAQQDAARELAEGTRAAMTGEVQGHGSGQAAGGGYNFHGLAVAVGLVFVSFAGLIKMASVSEEVKNPGRNLPLGMFLSLIVATLVNAVGVLIMVETLSDYRMPGGGLWLRSEDISPAATAEAVFHHWLPEPMGLILICLAAIAAFAASGNAGILGASRYPLAMSRDKLVPAKLSGMSSFGTPTFAVLLTAAVMIAAVMTLDVIYVAELAGAFNLLVFGLLSIAVIVMRESRIESYDPDFKSPLYPWMQIVSIVISLYLIWELGTVSILFSLSVIAVGVAWYWFYARGHAKREGAIYHIFERLGHHRHDPLDAEFREILKEKGARATDPFDDVIARATVIDAEDDLNFVAAVGLAAKDFASHLPVEADAVRRRFIESGKFGDTPMAHGAALPHFRTHEVEHPDMVIVRSRRGFVTTLPEPSGGRADDDGQGGRARGNGKENGGDMPRRGANDSEAVAERPRPKQSGKLHAVFFLLSPEDNPGRHLRILAHLAGRLENENFMEEWLAAKDEQAMKEVLLRDEQYLALHLREATSTGELIGERVADLGLPAGVLIAMVRRRDQIFVPHGQTVLETDDRLTIIGNPKGIRHLQNQYLKATADKPEPQAPGNNPEDDAKVPVEAERDREKTQKREEDATAPTMS